MFDLPLTPLTIGSVRTTTNLVLSPMSGVTDCAFRGMVQACSGDAVGLLVSEFIAAEGLTRDNAKTLAMLRYVEAERPISIQIFGADVERMIRAAQMVEDAGADIVDVNCGCPAPKVVKRGGGAQLMRMPERLREILAGIRAAVRIPMTVKIRSGWDADGLNACEIAKIVENEGADMLAVHGRTRVQLYRGDADWDLVRRLRDERTIPVLGSGDVVSPTDALGRLAGGFADGVLIGRASVGNPWIFRQIADVAAGRSPFRPSAADRVEALAVFREGLRASGKPDRSFIGRYRGLACRFVKGMAGGAYARRAIGQANTVETVDLLFSDFVHERRPASALLEAVA
jgi:nifR3 family TIM-barrel protein